MRLVNPIGREKLETIADFDITPFGGCACSLDKPNAYAETAQTVPPYHCACQCSHGNENYNANGTMGML